MTRRSATSSWYVSKLLDVELASPLRDCPEGACFLQHHSFPSLNFASRMPCTARPQLHVGHLQTLMLVGGNARVQREAADLAGIASDRLASPGRVCKVTTFRTACFPVTIMAANSQGNSGDRFM